MKGDFSLEDHHHRGGHLRFNTHHSSFHHREVSLKKFITTRVVCPNFGHPALTS